ncbi:MAG TPA: efflux RND transporter periplasmic adaptor subunit [Bryobacteraceae bacterium]|nr:efflux RND transporter periplasmic adaptor subunit [Bryobacteraceae bacterium]
MRPRILECLGLLATLLLAGCSGKGTVAAGAAPEAPVTVATVVQRTAPIDVQVIGNVEAYETISVKSQVGGILERVFIQEGDFVKKGDRLFTIDPRPYDAAVKQAEANLLHDDAALKQAEANLRRDIAQEKFSRAQAKRYAHLYDKNVIAKQEAEQFETDADAKQETVMADRAAIETAKAATAADEAALDSAKVQLSYTRIDSPIDGRTGNLNVKQGNVVKANDIELITINRLEPIYVTFAIPEDRLVEVRAAMAEGRKLAVMANPGKDDNTGWETGQLTFIDNAVDATTGAIKLKGTFPNKNHRLWPGKFVRVVLRLGTLQDALLVPTQAVQTGQDGDYVFVVKPDRTVESRPVVAGVRVDTDQVIEKGLRAGETVVTEGHVRLVSGTRVRIKNAPTFSKK